MAFDPDAYLADSGPESPKEFDPDAYLAPPKSVDEHFASINPDNHSLLGSMARGATQGATLGFADEIGAGSLAVQDAIKADRSGSMPAKLRQFVTQLHDAYRKDKTEVRGDYKGADDEHPVAYNAAMLGAMGPSAALSPVAQGAAMGYGNSEAKTALGDAANTAVGGALGKVAEVAGPYIGKGVAKLGQYAKIAAGEAAQVPQRAYEAVAEKVGSMLPDKLKVGAGISGPPSARVDKLRALLADHELGEGGSAARQAFVGKAGDDLMGKRISEMTQDEQGRFADGLAAAYQSRGINATTEQIKTKLPQLLAASGVQDFANATGDDAMRLVLRHDMANAAKRLTTSGQAFDGLGKNIDPRVGDMLEKAGGLRQDFEAGKLDRVFGERPAMQAAVAAPRPGPPQMAAPDAQRQLNNIAAGRKVLPAAAGAVGLGTGGITGGIMGQGLPKIADYMGAAGQALKKSGQNGLKPEAMAENWIAKGAPALPWNTGATALKGRAAGMEATRTLTASQGDDQGDSRTVDAGARNLQLLSVLSQQVSPLQQGAKAALSAKNPAESAVASYNLSMSPNFREYVKRIAGIKDASDD